MTEDHPLGNGASSLYYSNAEAAAERMLTEALEPSNISLTIFRPYSITGPRWPDVAASYRNGAMFKGHDPRTRFVHEEDEVAAFVRAPPAPTCPAPTTSCRTTP